MPTYSIANMVICEKYLLDTDPATEVFRSTNDTWYWNWYGETTARGPFATRDEAETAAFEVLIDTP